MNTFGALRDIFYTGTADRDGEAMAFEGQLERHTEGREFLEQEIGYQIPQEIAEFLQVFGGTKLFVDSYGLGVTILRLSEISNHNHQKQESEDEFWPKFMIFGYGSSDDMLCLYNEGQRVHFGILDHEAWGCSEVWVKEAIDFVEFADWLKMLVSSRGKIIPTKVIRYDI
jgi:hypothetical protein